MPRPQLVFAHGFGCRAADWSALLPHLGASAECLPIELADPADGGPGAGSPLLRMAERVNDARRASGATAAVLVGHSMGCRMVLEAARRLPDAVEGLVLIEGSLRAVGDPAEAVGRCRERSAEEGKALLMRDFAGMFSDATPVGFREAVMRRAEALDGGYAARLLEDLARWDAAEAAGALAAVRAQVLVIQSTHKEPGGARRPIGADDVSPWLRLIAERGTTQARVARLRGLGHFPHVEAPARVGELIASFVGRLGPPKPAPR